VGFHVMVLIGYGIEEGWTLLELGRESPHWRHLSHKGFHLSPAALAANIVLTIDGIQCNNSLMERRFQSYI